MKTSSPGRPPKLFLTRRWPEAVEQALRDRYSVTINHDDRPLGAAEIQAAMRGHDVLCPTVSDRITSDILGEIGQLKLIANYGAGFDHIDLQAARAAGLAVTNTPDVLTEATAELAILLMLSVARRAGEGERELRAGRWTGWRPTHLLGRQVAGRTLGLVGFGRIGQLTAKRACLGLGMRVLYHARTRAAPDVEAETGAQFEPDLLKLASESDVVSLHCPGGPATQNLIGAPVLEALGKDGMLINTARGSVVDEAALIAALKAGVIAGAGLDVFAGEPQVNPELLRLEQVVLLPHLGSATRETRTAMGMRVAENINAFFEGRKPMDLV